MCRLYPLFIFLLIFCLQRATEAQRLKHDKVQTYVVNLDLPPRQRWTALIKRYDRQMIMDALESVMKRLEKHASLRKFVVEISANLERFIPQPYADELRGIADALNCNIGIPILFNIFYDITAYQGGGSKACTSIVTMDKRGRIIHGRNFDYNFAEFLRNTTVNLYFQRSGKTLYYGTSNAMVLTLSSAVKPGLFSITFNARNKGFWLLKLISALDGSWAMVMFSREIFEKADSYDDAIRLLKAAKTIAPLYAIVGGVQPYEGSVLIGDRWGMKAEFMNDSMQHGWYVVETNYDPWDAPPKSDDRRDVAISYMENVGQSRMDVHELFKALSIPPVLNNDTVLTAIMSASDDSIFHTTIRHP